ncbi:hypothetical protein ACEPAF_2488 [Sanghuangporus sanghuang]
MTTTSLASTSSTTLKTMSSPPSSSSDSVSDSSHSSPNSSGTDSPLVSFEHPLDSNDPLNVFLNPDASTLHSGSTGDLSTDGSLFSSTPPSSHDSPGTDWSASGTGQTKDTSDQLWQHPDLSLFPFDSFNSSGGMEFSLGFDSMLFPSDPLFSMNSSGNGSVDRSSFTFNFGQEGTQNVNAPTVESKDRNASVASSSGMPVQSVANQAQAPLGSMSNVSHSTTAAFQPASSQEQISNGELMDELAARARQLVGLTMALPFGENTSVHADQMQSQQQTINVPTPFLKSSAQSESPTSTPSSSVSPAPTPAPTNARTKTSHTTIERRYRTNLNARIQSLRAAVPALRVLEVKQGNRVGNLSFKAGTRRVGVDPDALPGQEDVIDERGYIDGVKVARKGSKANVLGKAVEYIHVLKRREMRLKREQDGLKALIRSLVGGPELVQQWEKMWRERFGGPEKDEIDPDDAEADDDDGEDDDEADEIDEGGTISGRKRKRTRADPVLSANGKEKKITVPDVSNYSQSMRPVPIIPSQNYSSSATGIPILIPAQPEKRKRGRPRKVQPPPLAVPRRSFESPFASQPLQQGRSAMAPVSNGMQMEIDPASLLQADLQPSSLPKSQPSQQYLLAVFAFFSFFNSPISYSSASHRTSPSQNASHGAHTGSVLGGPSLGNESFGQVGTNATRTIFGWRDAVQFMHLVVSALLLLSVIAPRFPGIARRIPHVLKSMLAIPLVPADSGVIHASQVPEGQFASEEEKADAGMRMVLLSALSKSRALASDMEAEVLREVLGLRRGVSGLIVSLTRQLGSPNQSRSRYGLERRMLEQKAFLRFAELIAMDANASITTRIQTYLYSFKFFSAFSASVKVISTLALVIRPIWHAKSASLWSLALSRAQGKVATNLHVCKPYETYVLESMTVDEAGAKIATLGQTMVMDSAVETDEGEGQAEQAREDPLALLAKQAIRDFIREHSERVFLYSVSGDEEVYSGTVEARDTLEHEICRTVDASRSLDGRTARLADMFERVCKPSSAPFASEFLLDSEDLEIEATSSSADSADNDAELCALLRAIVLYRRIFPSATPYASSFRDPNIGCRPISSGPDAFAPPTQIPSPPPSPSRRDAALHLALRRCLDSSAFDSRDIIEDARDRVVDMLTAESSAWPKRLKN